MYSAQSAPHDNPPAITPGTITNRDPLYTENLGQELGKIGSASNQLAASLSLPQPEVPKFKGDVTTFFTFIASFDAPIESRTRDDADRLYYLCQLLEGDPKELIDGCLYMEPTAGYNHTRNLLQVR